VRGLCCKFFTGRLTGWRRRGSSSRLTTGTVFLLTEIYRNGGLNKNVDERMTN
jgi:hypothetical protein